MKESNGSLKEWIGKISNPVFHKTLREISRGNKEVQKYPQGTNLNFIVYDYISKDYNPKQICNILGWKPPRLSYYLSSLKRNGFIKRIGYGVWCVLKDFDKKELKRSSKIATSSPHSHAQKICTCLKEDDVRGHAFMWHLKLPKIPNWKKRQGYLDKQDIKYKPLKNLGHGQKIEFRGRKVHIKNHCVIVYDRESYIAEQAKDTKSHAIYEFLNIVQGLENLLNTSFKINKNYIFKVCREHYALVKNCLARQYDKDGKRKLYVSNYNGMWFVIDNSYNLHEAETIKVGEAVSDNEGMQNWLNSLKSTNFRVTPDFILNRINDLVEDRIFYAENNKSHVAAVQELAQGNKIQATAVKELAQGVIELREEVKKINLKCN